MSRNSCKRLDSNNFDAVTKSLRENSSRRASMADSSMADDLKATRVLVHDLHQDLKREFATNEKLQESYDEAIRLLAVAREGADALEAENEKLRKERDDAKRMAFESAKALSVKDEECQGGPRRKVLTPAAKCKENVMPPPSSGNMK